MAVAQGTPVMLLNEPTTYLDLACRYADRIVAMKAGRVVAEGTPAEVVTAAVVEDVFGLRCVVGGRIRSAGRRW